MLHGVGQRGPGDLGAAVPARAGRSRQLGYEFAKFGVIGVTGIFITNGIYDLLFIHPGIGPVTSRQRTGAVREIIIFAVLNGIGLLIQDAAVGFNYYLLHLGTTRWPAWSR